MNRRQGQELMTWIDLAEDEVRGARDKARKVGAPDVVINRLTTALNLVQNAYVATKNDTPKD